jgi:uncharacterized protein YbjT (DUF2867 family)
LSEPEEGDYPAAESYLELIRTPKKIAKIIDALRSASVVQFKAKDIFRASELSLLGVSNSHVEKDRIKIKSGIRLVINRPAPWLNFRAESVIGALAVMRPAC